MLRSKVKPKLDFWFYRLSTVLRSLKTLYSLSPEQIEAFLNSYNIYDHEWEDTEDLVREMGPNYHQEVKRKLVDYYSVLNHLCSLGQVEKMYIPPALDLSVSIIKNQELFEEKMSRDLKIGKGSRVLEIGCGRGRILTHVATVTGANAVGMNIDPGQLESARKFVEGKGIANRFEFKHGDLNELPLPFTDNSLDAVYEVQVFSLSHDMGKLIQDVYRILKPGGRLACLDWARLDAYDSNNPEHLSLMRRVKPLLGAIGTPLPREYIELFKKAGFEVLVSENASIDGLQAPLIEKADKFFTRVTSLVNGLVKLKLLPAHFKVLLDRLTKDGEAFIEADRKRLVTTSHYTLVQKPLKP